MAFLKHPSSDRIVRETRGTSHYNDLINRGYQEVSVSPGNKRLYVLSKDPHGNSYPLARPISDLERILKSCPDLTDFEQGTIRSVIIVLSQKLQDQRTLIR